MSGPDGPQTEPLQFGSVEDPLRKPGRHAASQGPTTGPIHRIPLPPAGRHQEDDLDPKRWPWIILVLTVLILAGGGGIVWGRATGYDAMRAEAATAEVFTAEPVPAPTETVTKTPKPKPRATKTVTAKAAPRPVRTVWATPPPGPTVYRTRTATPRPRPAVTRTRTREIPVCYQVGLDETREEIPCP